MLDRIEVKGPFDVNAANSAIAFYWNLARRRNKVIVVEIKELEEPCLPSPTETAELCKEYARPL